MPASYLIPFISILLAELLDKSQMAVILLASRSTKHLSLFLGVMLAFILVDGSAIAAGYFISGLVNESLVRWISGAGFLMFGLFSLHTKDEKSKGAAKTGNSFLSGFVLIFLSEWGDKTQIAAGLFATRYDPVPVFLGVISALGVLSVIAIYLGKYISKRFSRRIISRISGVVFILTGLFILLRG